MMDMLLCNVLLKRCWFVNAVHLMKLLPDNSDDGSSQG